LKQFIARYDSYKREIEELSGATETLLHVHFGLLIFVLTALVMRRRMASGWPISVVFALALLNELIDYVGPSRSAYWSSAGDVVNTIFWPAVLFLLARRGSFRVKVAG
jgi:hypothetical protein